MLNPNCVELLRCEELHTCTMVLIIEERPEGQHQTMSQLMIIRELEDAMPGPASERHCPRIIVH